MAYLDAFALAALPPGARKITVKDPVVNEELKTSWALLSEEEKTAATQGKVKVMAAERETEDLGSHSTDMSAFHDTQATLRRVENEVSPFGTETVRTI